MAKRLSFDEQAFVADCASGFYTHGQLAQRYGMSPHTAGKIARGQRRRGIRGQVESARQATRLRTERAICERADRVVAMLDELMAGDDKRLAFAVCRELLHHLVGRPAGALEVRAAERAAIEAEEEKNRADAGPAARNDDGPGSPLYWLPIRRLARGEVTVEELEREQADWKEHEEDEEDEEDGESVEDAKDGQDATDTRIGVPDRFGSGEEAGNGPRARDSKDQNTGNSGKDGQNKLRGDEKGSVPAGPAGGGTQPCPPQAAGTAPQASPAARCASPGTSGTSAGAGVKTQVVANTCVASKTAPDVPVAKGPKTGTSRAHPQASAGPACPLPALAAVVRRRGQWTIKELAKWWLDNWVGPPPTMHDLEDALRAAGLLDRITPQGFQGLLQAT